MDENQMSAAEQLEKAVEAAGFVHPVAPAEPVVQSASSPIAVEATPSPKARIAQIAQDLTKASPSGVETLAAELAGLAAGL